LYADDLGGRPDLAKLVAAGAPWSGVWLKATEGTYYPRDPSWFRTYWPLAKTLAGERYGKTWWRGAYHFVNVGDDPVAQADAFLKLVDSAGGWDAGDVWPYLDVENSRSQPAHASAQQVIDAVSAVVARISAVTGRDVTLYGCSWMHDLNITDRMGCAHIHVARYTNTLPRHTYEAIGWDLSDLLGWQGIGVDDHGDALGDWSYPRTSPIGNVDISAIVIDGGGQAALDYLVANAWR
jgi:GH25 family lysozyme M1 (1,4-beta-N-acetylmuramidase)